jgi:hypothetical protein
MNRDVLLTTTRDKFLQAFMLATERALPLATTSLLRIAEATPSVIEKRRLLSAYDLVQKSGDDLNRQLCSCMEQLLTRSFETTYSTFRPSFLETYGSGGLALVDAAHHEDLLRINAVTGHFRHAAERPLRDLNLRIAILFEQDRINERENPFRPFLISSAMATAIDNLGEPVELSNTLFDQMAETMRVEIATIYDAVNGYLASQGIATQLQLRIQKSGEDADFREVHDNGTPVTDIMDTRQTDSAIPTLSMDTPRDRIEQLVDMVRQIRQPFLAEGDEPATALTDPDKADAPPNSDSGTGTQGVVATLQKLFSRLPANLSLVGAAVETSDPFDPSGNHYVSHRLRDCLDALLIAAVPSAEQMTLASSDLRNLIFEQREALVTATTDNHEQMTIDVVAMLFEFILCDLQVPAEVRAQLGRLQLLVLKIALRERSLLTDPLHPVRLLVNRIGSLSLGLQRIDPSSVRIRTEINRIVDTLLSERIDNAALLTEILNQFDIFIAQELRGNDSLVDCAVLALEKAQSRTLRFARLDAALAQSLDGLHIDPFLRDFLTTTWVWAIERAERQNGTTESRLRQLVPDLLWSIVPKHSPVQRSKLIGMLPGLVGTLREGMLQEQLTGIERLDVLDWLVEAHSRALRGTEAGGPDLLLETMQQHFALFTHEVPIAAHEVASSAPHYNDFLTEALHETGATLERLDPMLDQDAAPESLTEIQTPTSDLLAQLHIGVAITSTLGIIPSAGRLHWIDQPGNTLLLQMDHHTAPSMLSVSLFLRLLGLGLVGFSETAPLFERAAQALMLSAQQMEKADR